MTSNYRSGLEERIAKKFDKDNITYLYEVQSYEYVLQRHQY